MRLRFEEEKICFDRLTFNLMQGENLLEKVLKVLTKVRNICSLRMTIFFSENAYIQILLLSTVAWRRKNTSLLPLCFRPGAWLDEVEFVYANWKSCHETNILIQKIKLRKLLVIASRRYMYCMVHLAKTTDSDFCDVEESRAGGFAYSSSWISVAFFRGKTALI